MPRYSISVHRKADDISPVAVVICGYCKSIVIVVGSIGGEEVVLPLLCEQPTINNYPCGAAMALVVDSNVRETIDQLAAQLQETDDA